MSKLIKDPSSELYDAVKNKFSLPKYDVHAIQIIGEGLVRFRRTHIYVAGGAPFQYYNYKELDDNSIVFERSSEPKDIEEYEFEDDLPW